MPLTVADRRQTITESRVLVVDVQDELDRDFIDVTYIEEKMAALRQLIEAIDRDGPMPVTIAAAFVERFEAIGDHPEAAAQVDEIMNRVSAAAQTSVEVQAIPGVYRHPCRLLTFADGSQCAVPSDPRIDRSTALFGLAETYHLPTNGIADFAVPLVVEPDALLTSEEDAHIRQLVAESYAQNTLQNYRSQWAQWAQFAESRSVAILPAHPSHVIAWLRHRAITEGDTIGTIQFALQALKAVHRDHQIFNEDDWARVDQSMKALRRTYGSAQTQVDGLSDDDIAAIEATARTPREGRGGKLETQDFANHRGDVDVAMVRTMRDAMLRPSELLAAQCQDLEVDADGSAILTIRRSKTDRFGKQDFRYLPPGTVRILLRITAGQEPSDTIFPFTPQTLRRRIKAATSAAGLTGRFAGHSPRVGMTQNLAAAGTGLPALMVEGRWTSPSMPARYARRMIVKHGSAIARLPEPAADEGLDVT